MGNMKDLINKFLDRGNVFVVVGVSRNPEKYGSKVYFDLKNSGYEVYPINPNAKEISGNKCYATLSDLPKKPDVVDIVVPPAATERIVKEAAELGIVKVWMQPGSESNKAIDFCKKNDILVLYNVCVIIERGKKNSAKN